MNFTQYIIAALIVQTVRCNTIGRRTESEFSQTSNTDFDVENTEVGFNIGGDSRDFASKEHELITYDLNAYPSNDAMTSAGLYHLLTTSQTNMTSHSRVRRGDHENPKKKERNPDGSKKKKRKGKKKGKKGRKKGKGKKNKRNRKKNGPRRKPKRNRKKKISTTTLPITTTATSRNSSIPDVNQPCIRSLDCPEGYCCARQQSQRICKPYPKLGDICEQPRRKHRRNIEDLEQPGRKTRRNIEHFELCPCEGSLSCGPLAKPGKPKTRPRLFTCQADT